jgi:hypothetical protein
MINYNNCTLNVYNRYSVAPYLTSILAWNLLGQQPYAIKGTPDGCGLFILHSDLSITWALIGSSGLLTTATSGRLEY